MRTRIFTNSLMVVLLGAIPVQATADPLPVQVNENVSYVTGGVGLDESTAIKALRPKYPLTMVFAETTSYGKNQYLYGVQVEVRRGGEMVFSTTTKGPYLLVQVPPGNYRVTATNGNMPKTQTIKVTSRPKQIGWTWPAPADPDDPYR